MMRWFRLWYKDTYSVLPETSVLRFEQHKPSQWTDGKPQEWRIAAVIKEKGDEEEQVATVCRGTEDDCDDHLESICLKINSKDDFIDLFAPFD